MTNIIMPDTPAELDALITDTVALVRLKEFALALYIWLRTAPSKTGPKSLAGKPAKLGFREYAKLGIKGLTNHETVAGYWHVTQAMIDAKMIKSYGYGNAVELPENTDWPAVIPDDLVFSTIAAGKLLDADPDVSPAKVAKALSTPVPAQKTQPASAPTTTAKTTAPKPPAAKKPTPKQKADAAVASIKLKGKLGPAAYEQAIIAANGVYKLQNHVTGARLRLKNAKTIASKMSADQFIPAVVEFLKAERAIHDELWKAILSLSTLHHVEVTDEAINALLDAMKEEDK